MNFRQNDIIDTVIGFVQSEKIFFPDCTQPITVSYNIIFFREFCYSGKWSIGVYISTDLGSGYPNIYIWVATTQI